jgi:hypothetical protein
MTHRVSLQAVPEAYKTFRDRRDGLHQGCLEALKGSPLINERVAHGTCIALDSDNRVSTFGPNSIA